jgi:hypothetical protein
MSASASCVVAGLVSSEETEVRRAPASGCARFRDDWSAHLPE